MWWNKKREQEKERQKEEKRQKVNQELRETMVFVKTDKIPMICENGLPTFCFMDPYSSSQIHTVRPRRGTRKELLKNLDRFKDGTLGVIQEESLFVVRHGQTIYEIPYTDVKK